MTKVFEVELVDSGDRYVHTEGRLEVKLLELTKDGTVKLQLTFPDPVGTKMGSSIS